MTTPTLALNVSAPGAAEVIKLAEAVQSLTTNLATLAQASNSSPAGLGRLAAEFRTMRQEMTASLNGLRTDIVDGFKQMAGQVAAGAEQVEAEGRRGAVRIKAAIKSVAMGGDLSIGASGSGTKVVEALRKVQQELKSAPAAIEAEATTSAAKLKVAVDKVIKAATVSGYRNAGPAWWDQTLADQAKARAKLEAEYDKSIVLLNRKVAAVMKAATQPAYMPAGPAFWEKVVADQDRARLKLEAEYDKSIVRLNKKVAAVMKAATEPPYMPAGPKWWAQVIADQDRAFNQIIAAQVKRATNNPIGNFTWLTGAKAGLESGPKAGLQAVIQATDEAGRKALGAAPHFKLLAGQLNDAHSAARGLASGFGAMWLSWGNMLPLIAGASLSHAFKKAFDIGAEVSYNIKFMQLLGDKTDEMAQRIREALREVAGQSKFTLTELSKTMVELGQAGKSPEESLKMLPNIVDLATAGMVDLKTATLLVIQAQALFGLKTSETDKLVSQLYKATKEGVLNVEDLAGSFKYASEANTRFGATISQTLVALQSLAQAGIKGSSAGTAYINFLRDMHDRSSQSTKALAELRKVTGESIEVWTKNPQGQVVMRNFLDIMRDIAKASQKMVPQDADRLLAKIFDVRGIRTYFALLREGTANFEQMEQAIEGVEKTLTHTTSQKLLKETVQGQIDLLKSAVRNVFDQTEASYEAGFIKILQNLTALANSSAFREFVNGTFAAVQNLLQAVITLAGPLKMLLEIFLAYKAAGILVAVLGQLTTGFISVATYTGLASAGVTGLSASLARQGAVAIGATVETRALAMGYAQLQANAMGAGAATLALHGPMRGLAILMGFLTHPLVGLITTLAILGTAWWTMSNTAQEAEDSLTKKIYTNGQINIKNLDAEIAKLRERNMLERPNPYAGIDTQLQRAKGEEAVLLNQLLKLESADKVSGERLDYINKTRMQYVAKQREVNVLIKALGDARYKDEQDQAAKEAALQAKIAADSKKIQGTLTSNFGLPKDRNGVKELTDRGLLNLDNEMQAIDTIARQSESVMRDSFTRRRSLLDAQHRAELIDEGTFQAQMLNLAVSYEQEQIENLDRAGKQIKEKYASLVAQVQNSDQMKPEEKQARIDNLTNRLAEMSSRLAADKTKVEAEAYQRRSEAVIKYQETIAKLNNSEIEYWARVDANILKEQSLTAVRLQLAGASEEVRAQFEAEQKALADGDAHTDMLIRGYTKAAQAVEKYLYQIGNLDTASEEEKKAYQGMFDVLMAWVRAIETVNAKLPEIAKNVGQMAFTNKLTEQFNAGSKKITEDLADAILNGGKEGGAKLKEYLKNLLVRQPLKAVLQVILQPVGNLVQGALMQLSGLSALGSTGSVAGGLGGIGNLLSLGGAVGSFSTGAMAGLGTFGSLSGGIEAMTAGAQLFAGGSVAGGAGMMLGTIAPYAALAYGLYSLFGSEGGGPKTEGGYIPSSLGSAPVGAFSGGGLFSDSLVRGDTAAAKTISDSIMQGFQQVAQQFGLSGQIPVGVFFAKDPEGDSQTQLQVVSPNYNRSEAMGGIENVGRSDADFQAALAESTADLFLTELQKQLTGKAGDYLRTLNPFEMDATQINKAIAMAAAAQQVWTAFERLGPAFSNLANMTMEATDAFVQASGGIEAMKANMTAFYENFYTDEEKRLVQAKLISETLTKAGMVMSQQDVLGLASGPNAKTIFKEWVESVAALGTEGNATLAVLLSVAGAFSQLIPAAQEASTAVDETASKLRELGQQRLALEKRMYEALGKTSTLQAMARAEYDASNYALYDYVVSLEAAREAVNKALDAELQALDEKIAKERETASFYKSLAESLRKYRDSLTQGDLSPLTPGQKYAEAAALFQSTYSAAMGGDQDAAGRLQEVSEAFLRASQVYNASGEQYQYDFARVASALTIAIAKADDATTYASQQVTLLTEQKTYLQQQVNQLFGISNAIMSLADAIRNFQGIAGAAPSSAVAAMYQNILGRGPDAEGEAFWTQQIAAGRPASDLTFALLNSAEGTARRFAMVAAGDMQGAWDMLHNTGLTMAQLDIGMGFQPNQIEQWAAVNGLPIFHSGTSMVPRTGLALLERGEAVLSRGQVNSENAALLAELREMRKLLMAQIIANDEAHDRSAKQIVQGTVAATRRSNFEQQNARQAKALA